jgi:hypothetical protein
MPQLVLLGLFREDGSGGDLRFDGHALRFEQRPNAGSKRVHDTVVFESKDRPAILLMVEAPPIGRRVCSIDLGGDLPRTA